MPFKSEKQKRYLEANEPEIASRWKKKYGSSIKKTALNALKRRGKSKKGCK